LLLLLLLLLLLVVVAIATTQLYKSAINRSSAFKTPLEEPVSGNSKMSKLIIGNILVSGENFTCKATC